MIASEEHDGARFIVRTSDAIAGQQLYVYGGSDDRQVLGRAFSVLGHGGERPSPGKGTLLEIGANIGTTTVAALRGGYVDRVVAVEAHPDTARLLQQNLIANSVADRVVVVNAAVTDAVGEVELVLSEVDSGDHRVRPSNGAGMSELASRSGLTVPGTTVDALIEDGTVKLDETQLVWIDAQGHEPTILQGAQSLLSSDVPVLIEYWPRGLEASGGLDRLEGIVASSYASFIDLRVSADRSTAQASDRLPTLRHAYADYSVTDLLLLKD
jgi:FkbM family methyltransferase